MSGFVFFKNTDISNSGSSGSIPDPSVYGGRQIAVIKPNTAHLPSSPSDLVKNNYVIVDRNLDDSVFPFTIDSVTFLSKYDSAIYNGRGWELQSGIQNTLSVRVVDKTNESLSGNATTQQEINKENRKELQDLRSRAQILVGYFSSTEPTGAEEEDLWFETSADHDTGDDLPTTFPIQVKEYKNGAWSTTTKDYTPNNNDLWSNLNNRHGFYWFGNSWNLTDAVQPNLDPDDLEWNSANQISYKAHSVNSNVLGTDITDDSTLTQDATTNKIKVKMQGITNNEVLDNTLSFSKVNSNSIANGLENNNQKFVKADDFYDKAIVGSNLQLETTSLGDTNLVLKLKNYIDTTIISQKLLKQENDYTTLTDTDTLSYLNITTQELKDVALSAVKKYIQDSLSGAISPVLTNNLTANKILNSNANGKITASYDLKTSTGSSATDTEIPTNKLLYDNTKKLTTNSFTNSRGVYVDGNGNLATESVNLTAKTTAGLTQHKISQRGLITEYTSIGVNRSLNIKDNNLGINNTITENTTDGIKTFKVNANGLITGYTAKTLGRGLKDDTNVIGHSNTAVTAKTNTNIAGVSYDAYGHITGKGTEYSVQTSMPSSPTDSQFLTAKAIKNIEYNISITTLWTGTLTGGVATLSESIANFKIIFIRVGYDEGHTLLTPYLPSIIPLNTVISVPTSDGTNNSFYIDIRFTNNTTIQIVTNSNSRLKGVYGIK